MLIRRFCNRGDSRSRLTHARLQSALGDREIISGYLCPVYRPRIMDSCSLSLCHRSEQVMARPLPVSSHRSCGRSRVHEPFTGHSELRWISRKSIYRARPRSIFGITHDGDDELHLETMLPWPRGEYRVSMKRTQANFFRTPGTYRWNVDQTRVYRRRRIDMCGISAARPMGFEWP